MRHVVSLIAGIVVAPLVWGLLAFGLPEAAEVTAAWQADRQFDTLDLLQPLAFLTVAAVLFGLLATLRISPVGPLVAGFAYVALSVSLFFAPLSVLDTIPDDWNILDRVFDLREILADGILFLLGLALIMAVFSRDRWQARPADPAEDEAAAAPGEEVTQTVSEPSYATSAFAMPPVSAGSDATAPLPSAPTVNPPASDLWGPASRG